METVKDEELREKELAEKSRIEKEFYNKIKSEYQRIPSRIDSSKVFFLNSFWNDIRPEGK